MLLSNDKLDTQLNKDNIDASQAGEVNGTFLQ